VWLRLIEIIPTLSLHLPAFNCSESLQKVKGIVWYDYIEDVPSFIASKDVLIVPLFSGSGIRIKIPEAMNYGKPVISTSIGAEGLPFEHNKELLIADTADAFITTIETLHYNRSKLLQIAQAGNAAVRAHFDNYTLSKKLLAYYHRLCTL
jgi:glycosyltransferase involved in cell wall biosynthesis